MCFSPFQYDLSASQFSPDGRVFQIEYAAKAAEISGTAIGLRGKDGCILAVEKVITSKLHEPDSGRRIFTIENSIGLVNKNKKLRERLTMTNQNILSGHLWSDHRWSCRCQLCVERSSKLSSSIWQNYPAEDPQRTTVELVPCIHSLLRCSSLWCLCYSHNLDRRKRR